MGYTAAELNALARLGIERNKGLYLGPILLGYAFDSILLGVLVQQTIWNLIWSPADRLFNRIILFSTVFLSIVITIFNDAFVFHLFAQGFGNWYRLLQMDWLMWFPIMDCATVTLVHIFYLERAYQLHGRSTWVPIVVLPFILSSIAGAIASSILASRLPDAYDIKGTFPGFYLWIGSTLAADVLITSIIFYRLIKSKTGWSETDYLINRLIAISVETQLPSLVVACGFMISFGIKPAAGLNIFFELFHPKVYVIGLVAVLNSRQSLKDRMKPPNPDSKKMNTFQGKHKSSGPQQVTIHLDESYIPETSAIVPNLHVSIPRLSNDATAIPDVDESAIGLLPVRQGVTCSKDEDAPPFSAKASEEDLTSPLDLKPTLFSVPGPGSGMGVGAGGLRRKSS
ncbi:hypothetical protein I317_07528 [Kwoniella heveanensis CBS 569]|nr:hypothetical protein I317_07528 [Kwoniella heveanensis CBS 569]